MQIDYDESGEVDADEFLEFVDERRSPFTDHIFKEFDTDGSGEVDFNEFIGVCCTYCMYSKQEILRFTFDSFDDDGGGTLDEEEFMVLCKAVNNMNPTFPGNFTTALEEFDQNDDGLIDFDEFQILNRHCKRDANVFVSSNSCKSLLTGIDFFFVEHSSLSLHCRPSSFIPCFSPSGSHPESYPRREGLG